MICATPRADTQMDRHPGETLARILTAELDLNVLVHDRSAGVAACITFPGMQKLICA
jgi:hypothetical protein